MVWIHATFVFLSDLLKGVHQEDHAFARAGGPCAKGLVVSERMVEVAPRGRGVQLLDARLYAHGSATQPVSESSEVL